MSDITVLIIGCVNKNDIDELKNLLKDNRCTLKILIDILEWFNNRDFNYKQSREKIRKIINEKILQFQQDEKFNKSKLKMAKELEKLKQERLRQTQLKKEAVNYNEIKNELCILGIKPQDLQDDNDPLCTIKKKYHNLAMKHHSDKGGNDDKMKDINIAYDKIEQFFYSHKNSDKHVLKF